MFLALLARHIFIWFPEIFFSETLRLETARMGAFLMLLSCFPPGELITLTMTARPVSGGARTVARPPSLGQILLPPLAVALFWDRVL